MKNNFLTFFSSSLFLIILNISPSFCTYKDYCSAVFNCGEIVDVGFPFWGKDRPPSCGVPDLKLTCDNNVVRIDIMQVKYRVLQVDERTKTLRIARDDYFEGICPEDHLKNTTLDPNLFEISNGYVNLTLLYGCHSSLLVVPSHLRFGCPIHGDGFVKLGEEMGLWGCKASVVVPVRGDEGILVGVLKMEEAIREGFELKWKVDDGGCGSDCTDSGGFCGYDLKLRRGVCLCESGFSSSPVEVCRRDGGVATHDSSAFAANSGLVLPLLSSTARL
ncbi:hypothetical protein Csa_011958 [Cucumis sativus]|uniref:non-specific serine/threonine protein kinase n=1 Tax=Cucumis sativus TaxID=3659 RepID=A0A0A0L3C4_CUCSA|nr:hypothetical protein Csa_011958 [Cucumis sativus]